MCSEEVVSTNAMEIVYEIAKVHKLDQKFLDDFIICCFKESQNNPNKSKKRVSVIFKLMTELVNLKMFDIGRKIEVWLMYVNEFKKSKTVNEFSSKLEAWIKANEKDKL